VDKHHISIVIVTKAVPEKELIYHALTMARTWKRWKRAIPSPVFALQLVEQQTGHNPAHILRKGMEAFDNWTLTPF